MAGHQARLAALLVIVVTALVILAVLSFQKQRDEKIKGFIAAFAKQKQTVSTVVAKAEEWQPRLEAVGSLRAVNGADLSLEVAGIVESINFKSGDDVDGGVVLLHLRAEDDEAKLRSLQAVAELAQITLDRDQKQLKAQAVAQATVDADAANLKDDLALVAQQKALLDKKTLRAPFAGHLGIRSIDLGQYVPAGTTIVTLQALDPIFADFYLPEQSLGAIKEGQTIEAHVDTYGDQTFTGQIAAVSPKVDPSTRNVSVRATIRNPDHKLLPGMYVTVRIDTGAPESRVTLPQTAIAFNPYGSTVYVVENKGSDSDCQDKDRDKDHKCPPNLTVKQTFVTTGPQRGDQIAILTGVNDGDTVVSAGQNKLHNGSGIVVNNEVQPRADASPKPTDQ